MNLGCKALGSMLVPCPGALVNERTFQSAQCTDTQSSLAHPKRGPLHGSPRGCVPYSAQRDRLQGAGAASPHDCEWPHQSACPSCMDSLCLIGFPGLSVQQGRGLWSGGQAWSDHHVNPRSGLEPCQQRIQSPPCQEPALKPRGSEKPWALGSLAHCPVIRIREGASIARASRRVFSGQPTPQRQLLPFPKHLPWAGISAKASPKIPAARHKI